MKTQLSILFVAGLGSTASANAFLLNEFDAYAVGRGNSVSATDIEPSSIYYNVGGLAAAEGTHVEIGGSLVAPYATFTPTGGTKFDSTTSKQVLPAFFASSRLNDVIAIGVGFYTPFGLAITWPDGAATNNIVHNEALHTFFITPSVGANLGSFIPGLTVGAGFDIVPATVDLQQDVYFGTDRGTAHLGGTATGFGGRLGVMYRPHGMPQLSLGAMWRSDVKLDITGTGHFDITDSTGASIPYYRGQLPPDGPVATSITLPQSFTFGAAYRPAAGFEIEANVMWTNWSKFQNLNIDVPASMGTGSMTIVQPRNYEDKTTIRVGVEYQVPHVGLGLRAGYIYDPTPVKPEYLTAELPDIDRHDLSIGASKSFGNFDAHLGLLWVLPATRATSDIQYTPLYKGTYDVTAFVTAVTIGGKFGATK